MAASTPSDADVVLTQKLGSVFVVTINRPRVKNAINNAVYSKLAEGLRCAAEDDEIVCCVLTGSGDFFTSGADLKEVATSDVVLRGEISSRPVYLFMQACIDFPKLLVAGVNGPAIGIGVTLLLHCDLVFCSDTASFHIPFFQLALAPEFSSSVTLANTLGKPLANQMLFLGKKMSATEARNASLVSNVLPKEGFLPNVLAHLHPVTSHPLASSSVPIFKSLTTSSKEREELRQVNDEELIIVQRRFDAGHPQQAFLTTKLFSRSRL